MIELCLQEYPALSKILELAAFHRNLKIRSKALKYFIDNFEEKYSKDYDPRVNIAFLPCSHPGTFAKPSECYINSECTVMNFYVISQDLRFKVERFGVCQHPSNEKLLKSLKDDPPRYESKAKAIFEYLGSRQADFTEADLSVLIDLKFIPIRDRFRSNMVFLTSPRQCFFKVQEEYVYDYYFCVVLFF